MSTRVLIVAPHPDDETLGCGGTILRLAKEGAQIAWLLVTAVSEQAGYESKDVRQREDEISRVSELFGFKRVFRPRLPTTRLDTMPMADLVKVFYVVFKEFQPEQVYLPSPLDVHTDHRMVFNAGVACSKWFRHPSVRRVLSYETLSETEFSLETHNWFRPNCFVDISEFLERKLEVMSVYQSEIRPYPFPRSLESIRALATLRGATAGFNAAEAFQLLLERT